MGYSKLVLVLTKFLENDLCRKAQILGSQSVAGVKIGSLPYNTVFQFAVHFRECSRTSTSEYSTSLEPRRHIFVSDSMVLVFLHFFR